MIDSRDLHLPDLSITGFRGLDALSISRLGRVTLLTGRNSVGKTTVLDAVRVYATRGRYVPLQDLLWDRNEVYAVTDEDGDAGFLPDWSALFHGRVVANDACISIGPSCPTEQLDIEPTILTDVQTSFLDSMTDFAPVRMLKAVYRSNEQIIPGTISLNESTQLDRRTSVTRRARREINRLFNEEDPPPAMEYEFLGPGLLDNHDLARLWDGVALTDDEERAIDALRLVFGSGISGVAMIGDQPIGRRPGRRAMVRLKNQDHPVPLRSLGDGALRMFGVALALSNSRDGFLLIDEAENGIHYSVQRDYWRMILQAAHTNNVQVLATTHSSDCIRGFAEAARELEDTEGVLVRLSRQDGELRAVEYPEEELAIAADQGIETR